MKKRNFSGISLLLAVLMVVSLMTPAFASYYPYSYSSSYAGNDYYNANYAGYYTGSYYMSSWASDLQQAYNPTWYEQPQRQVVRGEAFLLWLRAVQRSLTRQGYARLMSGYNNVPFSDYGSVNTYAQTEVNVLYSNGILLGYNDNTMRFNQRLTRAEMAAIYSRFNRIYLNMGVGYNQWNYDGYNNYYNNNYNSYYSNYMFNDIVGHWAAQDIITAASNGVLVGMGNGYFDTNGPLTIEQIWKMLDRCVGYQGLRREDIAYAMSQTFKVKFGDIDESYTTITGNGVKITSISPSVNALSITQGESRSIKVSIYPSNAEYQKLSWTSSNNNYVTVEESWNSSNGTAYVTIYGRNTTSNAVTLTGRALDGSGRVVTIRVTVNNSYNNGNNSSGYITSLSLSDDVIYLKPGQSTQLNARIYPSNAYNKNLNWASDNGSVAYASNVYVNGNYSYATITGNGVGTTYVRVSARDGSGETDSVKVVVQGETTTNNYITSATASPSSLSLNIGGSQNVYITAYPTTATNKTINWVSDNTNVARVTVNSTSSIQISGVGNGMTTIRGIVPATGNTVCTIPVTVTGQSVNPGVTDTVAPIVTLEGATSVDIYDTITITAKVTDNTGVSSFNIGVNDIIGMTGSLSPTKIEKLSNTEYRITLMGVEVASQCICIAGGVAVDAAGNRSSESNEIVIFVNSGE